MSDTEERGAGVSVTPEMVERVARAIQTRREQDGALSYDGLRSLFPESLAALHEEALAAMEALIECTDDLIDAGVEAREAHLKKLRGQGVDTETLVLAQHPAGTIFAAMLRSAMGR